MIVSAASVGVSLAALVIAQGHAIRAEMRSELHEIRADVRDLRADRAPAPSVGADR